MARAHCSCRRCHALGCCCVRAGFGAGVVVAFACSAGQTLHTMSRRVAPPCCTQWSAARSSQRR
eukprot:12750534-Alexandrium_andersonii.AAC.1